MKPTPLATDTQRFKTPRKKLFDLHSWVGFQLAVFMTLVVATGTLAVISDEIDWLIHPELRASAGELELGWGEIENAVRDFAPGHTITAMTRHEGNYFNYRVSLFDPYGRNYFLYVDPYTAEVTGETGTLTVQRFLRDLHRYLFLPSIVGLPLVTTMAIVLLISLYTGMKTVRNWATVATRVRFSKGIRVALGDFHKFAGLWSIWFFVVVIVTSIWYFAELMGAVMDERFEPSRPGITAERLVSLGPSVKLADAATLVAKAESALPGYRVTDIEFAITANLASSVLGRYQDPLVRSRANRIFMDPVTAEIIHIQRSSELGWVAYLNELADPLHFGSFGGIVTKGIWFIFGLAMLSLTLTGVWLTWQRLKKRAPTSTQWAALPVLLIVGGVGVSYVQSRTDDGRFEFSQLTQYRIDDSMDASLRLEQDATGRLLGPFSLALQSRIGRINLADAMLRIHNDLSTDEGTAAVVKPRLLGETVVLKGHLNQSDLGNAEALELTLTFLSGESIQQTLEMTRRVRGTTETQ